MRQWLAVRQVEPARARPSGICGPRTAWRRRRRRKHRPQPATSAAISPAVSRADDGDPLFKAFVHSGDAPSVGDCPTRGDRPGIHTHETWLWIFRARSFSLAPGNDDIGSNLQLDPRPRRGPGRYTFAFAGMRFPAPSAVEMSAISAKLRGGRHRASSRTARGLMPSVSMIRITANEPAPGAHDGPGRRVFAEQITRTGRRDRLGARPSACGRQQFLRHAPVLPPSAKSCLTAKRCSCGLLRPARSSSRSCRLSPAP